ncbi:hypothetical protein CC1G_05119 [Coprinopsis cinerea okayama7|uniref:Large ribosomal subunit protein mL49 n=1 Tax=Coprinopsis cinerea (strain Okayama-7 / 130 / ATCC MYA-4618 / FGSC 9003) TaxID=240176 RepID=A8NFX4_COPC7|nr:hypothetical protein CC1G_05119 [Coprinopsis cinerea okayama7\|eukprot:XP_001833419.1 hypothetical protein CC1G_05119 [Coprinopsis cinerea okayama7\
MFRSTLRCCQQALASASTPAARQQPAYFVQRNANGNLPVYTDVRNAGSRILVQIRNVDGSVEALAKELSESLFEPGTREARKLAVRTKHQHIVIAGGRWKQEVVEWLKARGF